MNKHNPSIEQQVADVVRAFQKEITDHTPKAVTVVLSEDTLVITLHDALTPAEKAMAKSADGAARIQEFHRQLFANSSESLRKEINRITGRQVREATAEIEPATGTIVHAFTTGAMVQVFLLEPNAVHEARRDNEASAEISPRQDSEPFTLPGSQPDRRSK